MLWNLLILTFLFFSTLISGQHTFDLTVIGKVLYADGLGRQSIGLIDTLKEDLLINFIPTEWVVLEGVSPEVKKIILDNDKTPGKVAILESPLWYVNFPLYQKVPASLIKIAYSMLESTKIPNEWVEILNRDFDAVVVPDRYFVEVYQNSGVTIPIFEVPLGIYIDEFLRKPQREAPHTPFVFGTTAKFEPRKNYPLLIKAFAAEFGNSDQVVLKINSRWGGEEFHAIQQLIHQLGISNIIITTDTLDSSSYVEFVASLDCFVNVAKGEGFSLCPRETLALGIPSILSNNTAQKSLCESGFFRAVPSEIEEPVTYPTYFGNQSLGVNFNCTVEDLRIALRDVYQHYSYYLQKAQEGRQWVTRFCWPNLKNKYANLVKPKTLVFGVQNIVTDDYLMTNSESLYRKYQSIINPTQSPLPKKKRSSK